MDRFLPSKRGLYSARLYSNSTEKTIFTKLGIPKTRRKLMSNFVEKRFPVDISYNMSGGPEYFTNIIESQSGFEQRNINWWHARNRYNISHSIKTKTQLDELIAFFRNCKGKALGFRFKDWTDYIATNQYLGTGNGIETNFQLVKQYLCGSRQEMRIINKPVEGSIRIFLNSLEFIDGFKVDYTKGMVTFESAPGEGIFITADFEFDVPVRFDTDILCANTENYNTYSWHDINLIEIKV